MSESPPKGSCARKTFSYTQMSCAMSCMRRYAWKYIKRLVRIKGSPSLRFGSAFHVGVDMLAKGSSIADVVLAVRCAYSKFPDWCTSESDIDDWMVECETVVAMLRVYAEYWKDRPENCAASELPFSVDLRNPKTGRRSLVWRLVGKIDRILRGSFTYYIGETKTTSDDISPSSDYWARVRIDQQLALYAIAARQSGYNVTHAIYDVARKSKASPRKLTKAEVALMNDTLSYCGIDMTSEEVGAATVSYRETPRMFGARLYQTMSAAPGEWFVRQEIPLLEPDVAEFNTEAWQLQKSIQAAVRNGAFPRNTGSCIRPYKCDYFDLCSQRITPDQVTDLNLPPGYTIEAPSGL